MIVLLTAFALLLAALPAVLFVRNLRAYSPPPMPAGSCPALSVLIPARNEAHTIGDSVAAVLASRDVTFEVIVLDDHSDDATAAIVGALAARDSRLSLHAAPDLPPGWCGKPHACAVLARLARHPILVFLDADVRLAPDALARMAAFLDASGADLASGIPRQETEGLLERLVIPLMHFVLLGFLPLGRMRALRDPMYGAGCGQLFVARRDAYDRAGGHAAIRATLHDGLKLPRAFRAAGLATDLCDATPIASCRMYRTASDLWSGLAKNAGEALASPRLIVPMSVALLGGQVLPFVLLVLPIDPLARLVAGVGVAAVSLPRWAGVVRFRQSALGALLHPLGIAVLVAIQWYAFARGRLGRPATWKGRTYGHAARD